MKKSEFQHKARTIDAKLELEAYEKNRRMVLEADYDNRASNLNRARSVTVGTAFGGTTELMMRSDGGRHIWCTMQPVEVIELIHQLAAIVGCSADLIPRKDFASWRDWRESEAEKKHLNGHPPFVNDMALFQQLGASGYNDAEAQRILNVVANVQTFVNENRDEPVLGRKSKGEGAPNLMFIEDEENERLAINKLALDEQGNVVYMAGGEGGKFDLEELLKEKEPKNVKDFVATKKNVNKRTNKLTARASK